MTILVDAEPPPQLEPRTEPQVICGSNINDEMNVEEGTEDEDVDEADEEVQDKMAVEEIKNNVKWLWRDHCKWLDFWCVVLILSIIQKIIYILI